MDVRFCKRCDQEYPHTKDHWVLCRGALNVYKVCKKLDSDRYRAANAEKLRERSRLYYKENADKELARIAEYKRLNPSKRAETKRKSIAKQRQNDPSLRLKQTLRSRLLSALKGRAKDGSAVGDLGCSIEECKRYLEAMFEPGMSWENHGKDWEIDHIEAFCFFDVSDRMQLLKVCNYTNLQPLWKSDHLQKTLQDTKKFRELLHG